MLNKLDILSGLDEVYVCTAYEIDGRRVTDWTPDADELARATPVYESFAGWSQDLGPARASWASCPVAALRYLDALEDLAGVPITLVSVGPERTQTITRRAGKVRAQVVA